MRDWSESGYLKIAAITGLLMTSVSCGGDATPSLEQEEASIVIGDAPVVGAEVAVGSGVYEVAVASSEGNVYVAIAGGRTTPSGFIEVRNAETLELVKTYDVQGSPIYGLGLNERTRTLFGNDTRGGTAVVLDLDSGEKTVLPHPDGDRGHLRQVVVDEDENIAYMSNFAPAGEIWVIDGNSKTVSRVIKGIGEGTAGLAYDKAGKRLFASNLSGGDIAVVDIASGEVSSRFPSGAEGPINLAYDAKGSRLFVTNQSAGVLTVLNSEDGTLISTVPTGEGTLSVKYHEGLNRVYVTNLNGGTVSVIDASDYSVLANLPTGTWPNSIAIHPTTGIAYVTHKPVRGTEGGEIPNDTLRTIKP